MHRPGEFYLQRARSRFVRTIGGAVLFAMFLLSVDALVNHEETTMEKYSIRSQLVTIREGTVIISHHTGEPVKFQYNDTHDTALPQLWVNTVIERTGVNPAGHVAWLYPGGSMATGYPVPLDVEGMLLLSRLAAAIEWQ